VTARVVAVVVAIAAGSVLAACDRQDPPGATGGTPSGRVAGSSPGAPQSLPNSSGNPPTATQRESNVQPVEGQVDAKQPPQQKDFRHPQEQAAPKPTQ
jgi:hypothetical protein